MIGFPSSRFEGGGERESDEEGRSCRGKRGQTIGRGGLKLPESGTGGKYSS